MSGNLVFDVENFRGTSVGDAARVFFDWASGRDERKQGLWGKPLNRITLRDLAIHNQGLPSNGLYVFYRASGVLPVVMYVGKCTSRSFLERVPAHLESREECWFNTLTTRSRQWNENIDDHKAASDYCLDNLAVAIVPIDCGDRDREKTSRVGLLERRLRDPQALNPVWNSCNTKVAGRRVENGDPLIDDLLYPSSREPAEPVL
tara:strand:- start:1798 stop:2409 length:612 start_codon:yes stop_codon:yes gene_type:complete